MAMLMASRHALVGHHGPSDLVAEIQELEVRGLACTAQHRRGLRLGYELLREQVA